MTKTDLSIFSLEGKTALIAGASRGIGLAIAQHIARAGARTILAARSMDALNANAQELRNAGFLAEAQELDISDRASADRLVSAVGDIDILINVSGMNVRKNFADYAPEDYERIMNVNLHGIVYLTQRIGERMVARGAGGKIIMIGSLTMMIGLPYVTVYGMTKSALGGLTKTLAAEWGRHNIQVNCIAPGFIITDLNRKMWEAPEMKQWLSAVQPTPHTGSTEDIGPLAVLLSGKGSDYITGQTIMIDGGASSSAVWPFEP